MRSKWVRILCMTMSILIVLGVTTASAQLSVPSTSNSLIITPLEIQQNISPHKTTNLTTRDIPVLLTRARIPEEYLSISEGDYQWHTFYGSPNTEFGGGIAMDANGDIYIAGSSYASWNGPDGQAPLHSHRGSSDITLLKLDGSGAYQWHTFFGSTDVDSGISLALDGNGDVYIAGESRASWNGSDGQAPLHSHSGNFDITVLKLDGSGEYQWHTFYGCAYEDIGYSLAVDGNGGIDITGWSGLSWKGSNDQEPLHSHSGIIDITVLKLDESGEYQWHTFYGSMSEDHGYSVFSGSNGNLYISGSSDASWNGPDGQAPLHSHSGGYDITVFKLDGSGTYQWHTFYGSTNADVGYSLAIDGNGDIDITGKSAASWNGPDGQAPLHSHSGSDDIVVLKLDGSGAYQWHTFYGSTSNDYGRSIFAGSNGDIYITGDSSASWNGPYGQEPSHSHSGGLDITVLKLDGSGAFQWHTFYGSTSNDYGRSIFAGSNGDIYINGDSYASWNGPDGQSSLNPYSGEYDIFVLMLQVNPIKADFTYLPLIIR